MTALSRRFRPALVAGVAAGALALAGCGAETASDGPLAAAADSGPTEAGDGSGAVPEPLRFTAAAVDGSTVEGAALAVRPTVAWFWTPWCAICRHEGPGVAAAQARYGDRVNFVGIAAFGSVAEMQGFVEATGVGAFPHAVDADGSIWRGFRVIGQPSFAFVDADGSVDVVPGAMSSSDLDKRIRQLAAA